MQIMMNCQTNNTSNNNKRKYHDRTMHEKGIRQYGDNRVRGSIKNPVIVSEDELMKCDEDIIPVDGNQQAKQDRQHNAENTSQLYPGVLMIFSSDHNTDDDEGQRDHGQPSEQVKNLFDFLKMDTAAFRHGQCREGQWLFVK